MPAFTGETYFGVHWKRGYTANKASSSAGHKGLGTTQYCRGTARQMSHSDLKSNGFGGTAAVTNGVHATDIFRVQKMCK